jgi:RNA polymerase subunit RPABC4/transcription elongation factor Spt4
MKLKSIKKHLRPYSILQKRKTTVNNAFASALAPCDPYNEHKLTLAMEALGQTDLNNLRCVYCQKVAETWDHLVALVKDSELHGYGHQIGNLVPSCKACNSLKGSREWRDFLHIAIPDTAERERLEVVLEMHVTTYATAVDLSLPEKQYPGQWHRYREIKQQILRLHVVRPESRREPARPD